jgi:hypothetical protein
MASGGKLWLSSPFFQPDKRSLQTATVKAREKAFLLVVLFSPAISNLRQQQQLLQQQLQQLQHLQQLQQLQQHSSYSSSAATAATTTAAQQLQQHSKYSSTAS